MKTPTAKTPEYHVWQAIKNRCLNPNSSAYPSYGGRGITMWPAWQKNYQAFIAHMGPRPPGYTVERIDNDGGYVPGNVKWASYADQVRNRRNNVWIDFRGRRMCITDWCREVGIAQRTFKWRLAQGWSLEKALTTPPAHVGVAVSRRNIVEYQGERRLLAEWTTLLSLNRWRVVKRLAAGWTPTEAFECPPHARRRKAA